MSSESKAPFELAPIFRERVWGSTSLEPYFENHPGKERIDEVWFTFYENQTPSGKSLGELLMTNPELLGTASLPDHPGVCPLLVKLLFTTERLSVQVHPDDDYAREHHGSLGKTEAWYVLKSEPPGEVAIGFRERLTPEQFEQSIKTGEIEDLLDWRKVYAGDTIFAPAGTVHAIGAGVTICEIQENSDITYRLYDYGRPRELHLDHGAAVSHLGPHEFLPKVISLAEGRDSLLRNSYFTIERLRPSHRTVLIAQAYYSLLICTEGQGTIAGQDFSKGRCWFVPANSEVEIDGAGSEWILTYTATPTD